jgi:hypothetical protein
VFQIYSSKPNNPKLEGLKEGVTTLTPEDAKEIGKHKKQRINRETKGKKGEIEKKERKKKKKQSL